ncbi:M50 family metallopeptidase [Ectobacillus panaciterrae]|uniref:M50 family metallopeptidase n=1 Tax=Ectobacillus panaciterrae TaxID=363872 RepID=UPI000420DB60|nr:M50 family metallopeptidase [Ectobacillus panaciterrae]
MNQDWLLYSAIILAVVSPFLRIGKLDIGEYFSCLSTMYHEDGHAIMAMLFGGRVKKISLFASDEAKGLAETWQTGRIFKGWLSRIFTAYAGYTTSSLVAFLCFYFIHTHKMHWLLYFFILSAAFNLVFWVRNTKGVFWLISFIGLCGILLYYGNPTLNIFATLFFSSVVLICSVTDSLTIFRLSWIQPRDAGDATSLAKSTIIAAPIWGTLFLAQSLFIAYKVFLMFIF